MASAGTPTTTAAAASIPHAPPLPTAKPPISLSLPKTRRRNYLRRKLFKTLPKPIVPIQPPAEVEITEVGSEVGEFSSSETTSSAGLSEDIFGNVSAMSLLRIGGFLVVGFVFQTVFAVVVAYFTDPEFRNGDSSSDDSGKDSKDRTRTEFFANGSTVDVKKEGVVFVGEVEMEERVLEIREMAREARERERLESKGKGVEGGKDDVFPMGVKKEVKNRIRKMRSFDNEDGKRKDRDFGNVDEEEALAAIDAIGSLMFKKKYKFRSSSVDMRDKPKGFSGTRANGVSKTKGNGRLENGRGDSEEVNALDKSVQIDLKNGSKLDASSMPSMEGTSSAKPRGAETNAGAAQEKIIRKPESKTVKPGTSSELGARNGDIIGKEFQDISALSTQHDGDSNLNVRKIGRENSSTKHGDTNLYAEPDFWRLNLPYVLGILMRRVDGNEGLFTLRSSSQSAGDTSHTVAFEDPRDANNFCYLLESFFEDLGDFSAEVVPLPTNDLDEAVKSKTMNLLVVKIGQLQLYAGQPLTHVEAAMRSLIRESGVS